jgi:AMP deaminase
LKYKKNPFYQFFARGLNVSLSTDDPLIFHVTQQPLLEEYSIASQVFDLSSCDLCEIARYSVLQSGYEDVIKRYWAGPNYKEQSAKANGIVLYIY